MRTLTYAWRLADFTRAAENVLIGELTKGGEQHPITEEALRRQLAAMREEVAGEDPSPLEKLLAERVVATWMQVQVFDSFCASELGKAYTKQADYHQRYLDRAHRRHLSAIKALAQIRKLGPAVNINIAEKQINTAG
jgi:ribonuclease D